MYYTNEETYYLHYLHMILDSTNRLIIGDTLEMSAKTKSSERLDFHVKDKNHYKWILISLFDSENYVRLGIYN